jgi:hypothetical protein
MENGLAQSESAQSRQVQAEFVTGGHFMTEFILCFQVYSVTVLTFA